MDGWEIARELLKAVLNYAILPMLYAVLFLWAGYWSLLRHYRKLAATDLQAIDEMKGGEFEDRVDLLLRTLGYDVDKTERFDRGADLIASKDGARMAVQVKSRREDQVDVHAVRAVVASKSIYACTHAMVVTNGYFTGPARTEADQHRVILWNRNDLAAVISSATNSEQPVPIPGFLRFFLPPGASSFIRPPQADRALVCARCSKTVTPGERSFCLDQPKRYGGRVYCMSCQKLADTRRRA